MNIQFKKSIIFEGMMILEKIDTYLRKLLIFEGMVNFEDIMLTFEEISHCFDFENQRWHLISVFSINY